MKPIYKFTLQRRKTSISSKSEKIQNPDQKKKRKSFEIASGKEL
jgi:hypothetical protein